MGFVYIHLKYVRWSEFFFTYTNEAWIVSLFILKTFFFVTFLANLTTIESWHQRLPPSLQNKSSLNLAGNLDLCKSCDQTCRETRPQCLFLER